MIGAGQVQRLAGGQGVGRQIVQRANAAAGPPAHVLAAVKQQHQHGNHGRCQQPIGQVERPPGCGRRRRRQAGLQAEPPDRFGRQRIGRRRGRRHCRAGKRPDQGQRLLLRVGWPAATLRGFRCALTTDRAAGPPWMKLPAVKTPVHQRKPESPDRPDTAPASTPVRCAGGGPARGRQAPRRPAPTSGVPAPA